MEERSGILEIMKRTGILSHSLISPLGFSIEENFNAAMQGKSGIETINDVSLSEKSFFGARVNNLPLREGLTHFENLSVQSIEKSLDKIQSLNPERTAFILSTTKGNIDLIQHGSSAQLHHTAKKIASKFGIENSLVVSNACTSGVMSVIAGRRLLSTGKFDHVIATGTDVLSKFVVSGFQSLHALSNQPCKPFDASRDGLNLGEASATVVLGLDSNAEFEVSGDGSTNDANHISGPSRTGEELANAILQALQEASMQPEELGFISAHGTATLYNDEMEANAFHVAGVNDVPVNSLKGYFGHTLGAAGLVEIVMSMESLNRGQLIPTKGFSQLGTSKPVNVISTNELKQMNSFLKTASGFGGCNAALIVKRKV